MEKNEKDLWNEMAKGNKEARKALILKNMGLVRSVIFRFQKSGYDMEELLQIGSIGLMKAIDHFDMEKGFQLSTYAVPVIMGEIRRFLRDDGSIHVARTIKENKRRIVKESEKLCQRLGREPHIQEIAEQTGLTKEEVVLAISAGEKPESVDQWISEGDGKKTAKIEQIKSEKDEMEHVLNHILLKELIKTLLPEEKKLLTLRYFEDMTQTETAKKMGINQVRVSRLEKKILSKMRRIATKT